MGHFDGNRTVALDNQTGDAIVTWMVIDGVAEGYRSGVAAELRGFPLT